MIQYNSHRFLLRVTRHPGPGSHIRIRVAVQKLKEITTPNLGTNLKTKITLKKNDNQGKRKGWLLKQIIMNRSARVSECQLKRLCRAVYFINTHELGR